ncbi:Gfo/Idh/MocA family protein [Propionibacteriaceae bacterium Y1923]|uniref:Gfo/Idh/MocA family protein n=1 Tax=Aestuariimicrobium sp. Y1814 TaxID=3418742 RepID=UPI003C24F6EF
MTTPLRWGIAGTGRIVDTVLGDLKLIPDEVHLQAIASRTQERADKLAAEHGFTTAHGSYQALVDDPDVDAIYIGTTHPRHKSIALAAIAAGKPLLVEKAFTATHAGAVEVVEAARAAGVFVMEAMWTRFQPAVKALHEVVAGGELGEIRSVQGDLCAFRAYDPDDRIFDLAEGGGTVLDLGVYPLSFAQDFLGNATGLTLHGTTFENGADAELGMLLTYDEGRFSTLAAALRTPGPGRMVVLGTKGWAEVPPRFHHPASVIIHPLGAQSREIVPEVVGRGYGYEFEEVNRCLRAGLAESEFMTLDDTLEVMKLMQQVIDQLGVPVSENDDPLG